MINKSKKNYSKRTIRRSQVISIFGVGSIYLFKNQYSKSGDQDSLMLAGLEAWENVLNKQFPKEWKIFEPRLQSILKKDFFLTPFDYKKNSDDQNLKAKELPYVRFPSWHYCHSCGFMKRLPLFSDSQRCQPMVDPNNSLVHRSAFSQCAKKNEKRQDFRKNFLIPMRFMVICENGHIDDFPFIEWVHRKNKYNKDKCELKFFEGKGGSNSVMNLRVECVECKEGYTLAEAFSNFENRNPFEKIETLENGKTINEYYCSGKRPWLGNNEFDKNCRKKLKVVLRQASNLYYPVVKSSIYIPVESDEISRETNDFLDRPDIWGLIQDNKNNKDVLKGLLQGLLLKHKNLEIDKVLKALEIKLKGIEEQSKDTIDDEESYKFQEYKYLLDEKNHNKRSSKLRIEKFPIEKYESLKNVFSDILLVKSLIETRVQTGFTRDMPYDPSREDSKQKLSIKDLNWLPGMTVKGEGIFIEFNIDKILEWEKDFNGENLKNINIKYNELRKSRGLSSREINYKFFLIHTFSHLLINQLSYSCGYGSSALRERIYCNLEKEKNLMNGVLIYTASGDSEGSLGGLVREGEPGNINKIVQEALVKARVCSYDPICLSQTSQGLNGTNASACHACAFLPETSCEEANQLLDRKVIIGDLDNTTKGFFEDLKI